MVIKSQAEEGKKLLLQKWLRACRKPHEYWRFHYFESLILPTGWYGETPASSHFSSKISGGNKSLKHFV